MLVILSFELNTGYWHSSVASCMNYTIMIQVICLFLF